MGDTENPQPGVSAMHTTPIIPASVHQTAIAEESADAPKPPSKTALKKAAKVERFAALKVERRAREKEAKKVKKRQRAEKRAIGELDADDEQERRKKKAKIEFGGRVVVDLGFDDKMSEKVGSNIFPMAFTTIPSYCSTERDDDQYCYLGNHVTVLPVSIHLQHQSKCILPLLFALHFVKWSHVHSS